MKIVQMEQEGVKRQKWDKYRITSMHKWWLVDCWLVYYAIIFMILCYSASVIFKNIFYLDYTKSQYCWKQDQKIRQDIF